LSKFSVAAGVFTRYPIDPGGPARETRWTQASCVAGCHRPRVAVANEYIVAEELLDEEVSRQFAPDRRERATHVVDAQRLPVGAHQFMGEIAWREVPALRQVLGPAASGRESMNKPAPGDSLLLRKTEPCGSVFFVQFKASVVQGGDRSIHWRTAARQRAMMSIRHPIMGF
jgi:hypothetical protein